LFAANVPTVALHQLVVPVPGVADLEFAEDVLLLVSPSPALFSNP
jgi:hypothetical protein